MTQIGIVRILVFLVVLFLLVKPARHLHGEGV